MTATIKDVAFKARVSVATVSKALNDKIHVSKKTREKVTRVAEELGYYPSAFGRGLVLQRTGNIGFVLDRRPVYLFSNQFYSRVLDGVVNELIKYDYNLLISSQTFLPGNDGLIPRFVLEKNVDGLIIIGRMDFSLVQKVQKRNLPMVFVDHFIKEKFFDCVIMDNAHGVVQAVNYLADLGHKKIGFLKGLGKHISVMERSETYRRTMKDRGLAISEEWIGEGDVTVDGGKDAMLQLLAKCKTLPTALLGTNDVMCIGAMHILREHGISIPEDISIIGFDDIDNAAHQLPPLTTVFVEKEEMGRIGAQLLIERIANPKAPAKRITLPTRLIIRKSAQKPKLRIPNHK